MDCICSPKAKMRLALRNHSFTYSASIYWDSCFVLDTASSVVDFSLKRGTSLAVQGHRFNPWRSRSTGSIPGGGIKIPHATQPKKKKKKEVNSPPSGAIQFSWKIGTSCWQMMHYRRSEWQRKVTLRAKATSGEFSAWKFAFRNQKLKTVLVIPASHLSALPHWFLQEASWLADRVSACCSQNNRN